MSVSVGFGCLVGGWLVTPYPIWTKSWHPLDSIWYLITFNMVPKTLPGWSLFAYGLTVIPIKFRGIRCSATAFAIRHTWQRLTATCQILSGGKVVLGIGAGWNEEEYNAYGW